MPVWSGRETRVNACMSFVTPVASYRDTILKPYKQKNVIKTHVLLEGCNYSTIDWSWCLGRSHRDVISQTKCCTGENQ